jgi:hypothetical protein
MAFPVLWAVQILFLLNCSGRSVNPTKASPKPYYNNFGTPEAVSSGEQSCLGDVVSGDFWADLYLMETPTVVDSSCHRMVLHYEIVSSGMVFSYTVSLTNNDLNPCMVRHDVIFDGTDEFDTTFDACNYVSPNY